MIVGIPREIKDHEFRVAATPGAVETLVQAGHRVLLERGAGQGSGFEDAEYVGSGAEILPSADQVWQQAEAVRRADVVIGAVLIKGAKAPKVVRRDMVAAMKPGSVVVDVAVDQGGSVALLPLFQRRTAGRRG